VAHYGSGALISADGYVLTVATPMLDTPDLRVHLSDGRRYHAKVLVIEPELDVALVKIDTKEKLELPYFDLLAEAKKPLAEPGIGILAFGNQFEIAIRDEPVSVQQGTIEAYSKLRGRRGIHKATFGGNVYVLDAITNNPGAAGGVLTTRKGQLLGLIGKELRNELTNTWINYAIPIQTAAEVEDSEGKKRTISIAEIVEKKSQFQPTGPRKKKGKDEPDDAVVRGSGITLVANVVELTPPYVEEVEAGSPAAKAGLLADDLIVYVDGEQVGSINELLVQFKTLRPEQMVKIEVRRGDKLTTLTMKVGKPAPTKKRKPRPEKPEKD
jgi:serine protease Do